MPFPFTRRTPKQPSPAAACALSLLLLGASLLSPETAEAGKKKRRPSAPPPVYVSNDATLTYFSPPRQCGAITFPCRTIQDGIEAAPDGGTVLVGPGVYANTDFVSGLGGRGERNACSHRGCGAVLVERGVKVLSTEGPSRTIVDLTGVRVSAPAVVVADGTFGTPGRGFTVLGTTAVAQGALGVGIHCEKGYAGGNLAIGNRIGMVLEACAGSANLAIDNTQAGIVLAAVVAGETPPALSGSYALANGGSGFSVEAAGAQLHGSQAIANGTSGFELPARTFDGRAAAADGALLHRNLSMLNVGDGFALRDAGSLGVTFSASTASANGSATSTSGSGEGFALEGEGSRVVGNVAVANGHYGIDVGASGAADHEIVQNQLIGNFTYGIGWLNGKPGIVDRNASYGNRICQIHNPGRTLGAATRGYWGGPDGPVGDVPTCQVPELDPVAASAGQALTWGQKKSKKKKSKKKSRPPAPPTWPVR